MKKRLLALTLLVSVVGALVLGGCGGGGGGVQSPTAPSTVFTNVSSASTYNGSGGNNTYSFKAGTYNVTIANFVAGDKLEFPAGMITPTVSDTCDSNGNIAITWAPPGSDIAVTLPAMNNCSLDTVAAFNAATTATPAGLGAGTITY